MEQFIKGIPSLVAAIPLQCLHQTRPCVFSLLFAPAPVSPSTPDSASIRVEHPKPCGGWKGLYWVRWLGTVAAVPSQRAVCGFGPLSFQLLFHRRTPVGSLSGIPRGEVGSQLAPVSCGSLTLPCSPTVPVCPSPGVGVPALHSSGVPHFLLFTPFFWQGSRADLSQGHLKSHSTWVLLRAGKAGQTGTEVPWSCLERRGKAKALVL